MAFWNKKLNQQIKELQEETKSLKSSSSYTGHYGGAGHIYPVVNESFNGEKTPGELGYLKNSIPDYQALRYRVYDAELKSDIVKIITGKFFKYVMGTGLKLQSEPQKTVLESEGIDVSKISEFTKMVEARFGVYAESKFSDYKQMDDLHQKMIDAYTSSFLGGDALCVQRVDKDGNLNLQVIDGQHIQTPWDTTLLSSVKERGNTIQHGIELDNKGKHVAYFILVEDGENILGKFERIEAVGKETGRLFAWMIYGNKHRIDHVRGIPVITQILEKVDKFDRYTEAAVGSAEERAKIVFTIEHNKDSDGENPLLGAAKIAAGKGHNAASETAGYHLGTKTAKTIAATTQKQTFNMPVGSQLKALSSVTEMQYNTFSKAVFSYLCAAVDIPPEVAMQLYEQNYSSSRAAINAWDYIVKIHRKNAAKKSYQPFYNMWLELEVLKNKVSAPGFIKALQANNFMVIESYSKARWTGVNMPHIDPLKEVKAVRSMLGESISPLISREQATEMLGVGDFTSNVEKFKEEEDLLPEIKEPVLAAPINKSNPPKE